MKQQLFQCKLCGKTYPRTANLRVHLAGGDHNLPQFRLVSGKSIQCEFCDVRFVQQSRLRRHVLKGKHKNHALCKNHTVCEFFPEISIPK